MLGTVSPLILLRVIHRTLLVDVCYLVVGQRQALAVVMTTAEISGRQNLRPQCICLIHVQPLFHFQKVDGSFWHAVAALVVAAGRFYFQHIVIIWSVLIHHLFFLSLL